MTSMQCPVLNLSFQIAIYHPITSNNGNNVVPVILWYTCSFSGREGTICFTVSTRHSQLKTQINIRPIK